MPLLSAAINDKPTGNQDMPRPARKKSSSLY